MRLKFIVEDDPNIAKNLILLKKRTAMNPISSFSLSLQKQIQNQSVSIGTELNRAFGELKFRSLLKRSGITKNKGYATISLRYVGDISKNRH